MKFTHDKQSGFTTVELLVTLFISVAFISIFYQLYVTVDQLTSAGSQRALASNIAYANLRKYASSAPPTWFSCSATTDIKTYPSAVGQTLISGTPTVNLPSPVTQSVIAVAPYGCSSTGSGMPVRITSAITYGPNNITITHVGYAGY